MLGIARSIIKNPIMIIMGNPTEIILREGADLVIIPKPKLISNTEINTGKAITRPLRIVMASTLEDSHR